MTKTARPVSESPLGPERDSGRQTFAGFAPSTVVLVVAVTCLLGLIWGAAVGNWVLVATEAPAVVALVALWLFARAHRSGRRSALIGSAVGALCAVELWFATAVFGARGSSLVILVAASTGVAAGLGGLWAIRSSHKAT